MSELCINEKYCELCGARCAVKDGNWTCNKTGRRFSVSVNTAMLAEVCKWFPAPMLPKPSEFEKCWESYPPSDEVFSLEASKMKTSYRAGWQACREKFAYKCRAHCILADHFLGTSDIDRVAAELDAEK